MDIPRATYRIQLNSTFGFQEVNDILNYLADLGISHIYASPIFKARKGSRHGYDVIDPTELNPELGSSSDFERLTDALKQYAMGWLQDIVPNHMAFDCENPLLKEVLEFGSLSHCHDFFDIQWDHPFENMKGRLLAPFLGSHYGECLQNGEIGLNYDANGFSVNYYAFKLLLKIESYPYILSFKLEDIKRHLDEDHPDYRTLLECLKVLERLSRQHNTAECKTRIENIKKSLWDLYCHNSIIKQSMDETIKTFNGDKENPASFKRLDQLLSQQVFQLSYWKVAADEINYRRFFDINELISLQQDKREVFDKTHCLLFRLIEEGKIHGLRIDHIDGLADPKDYLDRLRNRTMDTYILVEKILNSSETLPLSWPVQGTTGYEFADRINGVFCDSKNGDVFSGIYARFNKIESSFENIVYHSKRRVVKTLFAGDLDNLARRIKKISVLDSSGIDITFKQLKRALTEVLARFSVYRTYIDRLGSNDSDCKYIKAAVELAVLHRPYLRHELAFVHKLLLGQFGLDDLHLQAIRHFQQLTATLMAKGLEDTALYVYNRLLSLNEVGGHPDRFGCSIEAFHDSIQKRIQSFPQTMNTTATHDSKRGEDVRARLNVLSELPEEWEKNLKKWRLLNKDKKAHIDGREIPDENEAYFLYQTLIGAYPFQDSGYPPFVERIKKCVIKAAREAKVHTSWVKANETYETALVDFVERILYPSDKNLFMEAFIPFFEKIAVYGIFNTLSQTLIKMTTPGIPDVYQGTELFDFNLVDPDNRRPIDFKLRSQLLKEIRNKACTDLLGLLEELLFNRTDGRIKLFLIAVTLQARKENFALFQNGDYVPLMVEGRYGQHVIAFARSFNKLWSITVAPRLLTQLIKTDELPLGNEIWQDTSVILPDNAPFRWQNIFTNEVLHAEKTERMGDILHKFPVALLMGEVTN